MKILITGSNGLLGQKLVAYCLDKGISFCATSRGENRNPDCPGASYRAVDITSREEVEEVMRRELPTHVIHTAAMTNVDQCELNPEECHLQNVTATRYLVEAANSIGACFQFVSTDFIFDGEKGNYREDDEPHPLSAYGQSKLDGEIIVRTACAHGWSIVRTIIVYGTGHGLTRSNLIVWAKGALEKGDKINIIDDQFRAPTFAEDLAAGCMGVIEHHEEGVFHVSGPETMSIYSIVERIARHFDYSMENVSRISSATLNQPAMRPPRTGFDLQKAYTRIGYRPHTLEESLDIIYR